TPSTVTSSAFTTPPFTTPVSIMTTPTTPYTAFAFNAVLPLCTIFYRVSYIRTFLKQLTW
ncbi:unnamed protein product, partial [Rotaria magnacalcarata]